MSWPPRFSHRIDSIIRQRCLPALREMIEFSAVLLSAWRANDALMCYRIGSKIRCSIP